MQSFEEYLRERFVRLKKISFIIQSNSQWQSQVVRLHSNLHSQIYGYLLILIRSIRNLISTSTASSTNNMFTYHPL